MNSCEFYIAIDGELVLDRLHEHEVGAQVHVVILQSVELVRDV